MSIGENNLNIKRVLIVEDDRLQRQVLVECLDRHDFCVLSAVDIAFANSILRSSLTDGETISLLICDQFLPDGNGSDLCIRARALGWIGKAILLSASVDTLDLEAPALMCFDKVLQKSIPLSDLIIVCQDLLRPQNRPSSYRVSVETTHPPIQRFMKRLAERKGRLNDLSPIHDRVLIGRLAHQLCGTAMLYGLEELSRAASQCESAARRTGDTAMLVSSIRNLISQIELAESQN